MSYRSLLAANSGEPEQQEQQQPEGQKKARGRRRKEETAIAKTDGHQAIDKQVETVNQTAVNLATIQQQLIATNGYQTGQEEAEIHHAASRAWFHDRHTTLTLARIEGLAGTIEDRQKTFNPMNVLAELGFVGDDDDTQKKIQDFQAKDFTKHLL